MEKVNIIMGRFQPFTKGHMKCIEKAYKENGYKTVICMINTKNEKIDEKHPFPSSLLMPLYESAFKKNKMIKKIILIPNANIVNIGNILYDDGYEIGSWTCGTDRYNDYKRMTDKYAAESHLSDDFELIEIKRGDEDISATKVREALKNDDINTFNHLTSFNLISQKLSNNIYNTLRQQFLFVLNK